jgi:uncharacterized protein (TIRG00374 family)
MTAAVRSALVVAGLVSVGYLIATAGVGELMTALRTLSWRIAVVAFFPAVVMTVLDTLAWRFAFERMPTFRRLFWVRLAGEALNVTTASVGGEAVKVYLLRPDVPAIEASAGMLVGKTGITLAQVLFLGVGLAVALLYLELPRVLLAPAAAALVLEIGAVAAFVLIQRDGVVGRVATLLRRWGVHAGALRLQGLIELDDALATFYRRRRGRFLVCVALHLLAWVVGSLEVYLALWWLGFPVSLPTALFIDAVGSALSFIAFIVPGRLGVMEGGYMAVFAALGLSPGAGLSLALVRRLRLLVWSSLGVVVLMLHRAAPPPGTETATRGAAGTFLTKASPAAAWRPRRRPR